MSLALSLLLLAQLVDPPAAPGAIAPNAITSSGEVVLTWIEGTKVRLARLRNDRWSDPITVVESAELVANWADFPSAAVGGAETVVHFPEKSAADKYAYDVELARAERGDRFARIGATHDDGTPTEHGFVSIVPAGAGFQVFWLDGRAMAKEGPMQLRTATLKRGTVAPSVVLDDRVCECCQTSAAITDEGPFIAYRDRSEQEIRDIAVVRRTKDGWSRPAFVRDDGWKMPGCPVNGPATDASGKRAVVAWYTGADLGRVLVAFSADAAKTFSSYDVHDDPDAIPQGRVDVVLVDDGAIVSFLVADDERNARILYRHVGFDGARGRPYTLATTSAARASGFPRMVKVGSSLMMFWTEVGPPSRIRAKKIALSSIAKGSETSAVARAPLGANAPRYEAQSLDGRRVSLADHRGKVVLLNLWATWCGPCRREMPELIRIAKQHPDLMVVGVTVDEASSDDRVRDLVERMKIPYAIWRDPDDRASQLFRASGLPATFLIDREGRIAFARYGTIEANDRALSEALMKLGVR